MVVETAPLINMAGQVLSKLSILAFTPLLMLVTLEDDLINLSRSVEAIKAVLLDAERHKTRRLESVNNWLERLGETLYDADDVLDEIYDEAHRRDAMTGGQIAKQVRIFFSRSNQLAFNCRMASQVKNIRKRLDAISANKDNFHLHESFASRIQYENLSDQIGRVRETHSFLNENEVIGREDDKKSLKELLLSDREVKFNVEFIAIVGMGGIGKTTLAKLVYNDSDVSKHFALKMWVWVSEQFDIQIVVEKIIESATGSKPKVKHMDSLQRELYKVIGEKKYLLVLDDIWKDESDDQWKNLKELLMLGPKGSKIVITKRNRKAAAKVENMTYVHSLKGLSEDNSLKLFREVTFGEGREPSNQNFTQLEMEIVEKCGGVPLVIRHIGRLLYFKTSKEWMSFKNNELLKVTQGSNDMRSILELSYNHLPPHLKPCFAYSSLFPKGKEIEINELIKQWVAQGFIQPLSTSKSMEDIGREYFNELCWTFFYENSTDVYKLDDRFRMHDVMREVARNVAGNILYVRGKSNNDYTVSEQTRHISFDYKIESWHNVLAKLRNAKGLRTFLLFNSSLIREINKVDKAVLDELFSSFPRLRVLGLPNSCKHEVPDSIEKLRHLRYLDLSSNRELKLLPNSITKLQNLQTLNLSDCDQLRELPTNIRNLVNLRNLDFRRHTTELTHMPEGMEELIHLKTIPLYVLDCKRRLNNQSEMNEVENINMEHLRIIGLEQLRCSPSAVSSVVNLKEKKTFRHLTLEWKDEGEGDETGMEGLEPHPNVEYLNINGYSGVGLPNWVYCSLSMLISIEIENCHRLQHLPPFHNFPALENLRLKDLSLKFIDKNDPAANSPSMFFRSLKFLGLENMANLEGWWEIGESRELVGDQEWLPLTFHNLETLQIYHCPKLSSMPNLDSVAEVELCDVGVQMMSSIASLSCLGSLTLREIRDLTEVEAKEFQQNLRSLGTSTSTSTMGLSYLNIEECPDLMSLPEWIDLLPSLQYLCIMKCPKLRSLPREMRQLKSLGELHIADCPNLMSLPEWIGLLPYLRSLSIMKCPKFRSLPREMRQLKSLEELDIEDCSNLMSLPEWIDFLPSLQSLFIRKCPKLKSLPREIRQLRSLKRLGIEDWPDLMSLPEWIDLLPSLEYLFINKCPKLRSLTKGMRQLKYLKNLQIEDCPKLEERCKQGGEDWPNISHVTYITLRTTPHSSASVCLNYQEAAAEIWRRLIDFITNICCS